VTKLLSVSACLLFSLAALLVASSPAGGRTQLDLDGVIAYGLKHNPGLGMSRRSIEAERYNVDAARAERMPKVDVGSGATCYRYPTPLTPVVITFPINPGDLPDFERTIYDGSAMFRLPLYRGGRIVGNIRIAEMRKALAEDNYATTRQELIYNLTSVYHKILQLQRLAVANEASVAQFTAHRANVEQQLSVGSVARLDLLKTEVELAHARENLLLVRNNLDSVFELLRNLMGMEEREPITIADHPRSDGAAVPAEEQAVDAALAQRPDYRAVAKKKAIAEQRVRVAQGRRFPDVYAAGQYSENAGTGMAFKENWYVGMRLTVPVFDGGLIRAEVDKERAELEKTREEERQVRLAVVREVKDALIAIANAEDRMKVTEAAIASAKEALRVETLKYETGAGTSTDVIDARTASLRAETDYYQALYDREVARSALKKATGEYAAGPEVPR
jgi:outer membrane protein